VVGRECGMSGRKAEGKFRWGVVFLSGLEGEVCGEDDEEVEEGE
jgi:hypothetical protein